MELIFSQDREAMNWLRPDYEYARVVCPEPLTASVEHCRQGDLLETRITIQNQGAHPVFTATDTLRIAFPLEDRYDSSQICRKYRCHAHIFCGGNISYICALRMGGEAPHFGMVLTRGSLAAYSVERNIEQSSNDRGCFWLHPAPVELQPGEKLVIGWSIFPHEGWEDFMQKAAAVRPFVRMEASDYVIFPGETAKITLRPSFAAKQVTVNGNVLQQAGGQYTLSYSSEEHSKESVLKKDSACFGADDREKVFHAEIDGIRTHCRIMVQEKPETLADRRCHFIAQKQQYHGKNPHLQGAFLTYDNEEDHQFYDYTADYNGGRERVGMGILLARFLQKKEDADLYQSLLEYRDYVLRELVNQETGEVYNDCGRDGSLKRLYNWPWYATFFTELYLLEGRADYLEIACRILRGFYERGGTSHYSIELPVCALTEALKDAGMQQEREEMLVYFRRHGDRILELDTDYPPFEVNYEQSIVAPAANILLQFYLVTGEEKYLQAGKRQLDVLELFNGRQPDCHLYETAIRHWDGYWFGKGKLYGDTFPHYWSGLTGVCYDLYAKATKDKEYARRAESSLRGVLPLFFPDGTASCACVFPHQVNGRQGACYDPYANDQDWGLYFYLRHCADKVMGIM